jgi:hypothetical protein
MAQFAVLPINVAIGGHRSRVVKLLQEKLNAPFTDLCLTKREKW